MSSQVSSASASAPQVLESGPASAEATPTASTVQPDPISNPGGFLHDVRDSYRSSQWALLVVLCLYGLARLGQWASNKWTLKWLGGWKLKAVVVAVSVLGSVLVSIGDVGAVDWRALVGAIAAAVALYLQPDRSLPKSEPVASSPPDNAQPDPAAVPSGEVP